MTNAIKGGGSRSRAPKQRAIPGIVRQENRTRAAGESIARRSAANTAAKKAKKK